MRYHYALTEDILTESIFAKRYKCNHPVYNYCSLYSSGKVGLAVIQQYIDEDKSTYWSSVHTNLADDIYRTVGFQEYFEEHAGVCTDGLYPTVTVRQIMWALRMKPLKKERWETTFDHKFI